MAAAFGHFAVFKYIYSVGMHNGGKPVSDDNRDMILEFGNIIYGSGDLILC